LEVKVTLRNPLDKNDYLDYYIVPNDTQLAQDWVRALKETLESKKLLEKNFCLLGFPKTARTLDYLCQELNKHIEIINHFNFAEQGLPEYVIEEWFHPNVVRFGPEYPIERTTTSDSVHHSSIKLGLHPKHNILNNLHNHFEVLQGTVSQLSSYYKVADYKTKYAIRQLNNICHEMENLILSLRKDQVQPEWVRPSQITTFLHAQRHTLTDEHRKGFVTNGYDRVFGGVYMHWTQIGKTLFEVFNDEGAPDLDDATCEAITHLEYYSGEFDVEWGRDVVRNGNCPWHDQEQLEFENWLLKNSFDPKDPKLSLGFLPIGDVDLKRSFNTENMIEIHSQLHQYLDIFKIEVDGVSNVFDYVWSDEDYEQREINRMKPGYDFSSRG
jgi:hypothetical protein